MGKIVITELLGDGISPELNRSVHAVADALPLDFEFIPVDWSLENREEKGMAVIDEAEASMRETCLALKYPTVTRTVSPNALIRRRCNFSVIHRPAITIEGIDSNFKKNVNINIIRVATGGTYDDGGQMVGQDAAVSLRMVERKPCEQAAVFAFRLAREKGYNVTSASKHTIQKVTDGLFESVVDTVHEQFPDVVHEQELFDALLGKLILSPEHYQIVLVLNEYGDFLSDMASGLVGSLGTGASGNYSFDEDNNIKIAMFDPAGGTAPDIAGKNICNPMAILLSFGMLLDHVGHYPLGHALRLSMFQAVRSGQSTGDIGGKLSTSEFTDVVVKGIPEHL